MKTNFRIGESIVIDKPGILNGIHAKIIAHNTESDTIYKPLRVECEGGYVVALEYFEVKSAEKTEVTKAPEKPKSIDYHPVQCPDNGRIANISLQPIEQDRKKRKYTKKNEPKEVKPKRKYQKKIKS